VTFLEKICDMFSQMQRVLPAYDEVVQHLLEEETQKKGLPNSARMATALAFVYSDVVRFCFEACTIFTKKRSGGVVLV